MTPTTHVFDGLYALAAVLGISALLVVSVSGFIIWLLFRR